MFFKNMFLLVGLFCASFGQAASIFDLVHNKNFKAVRSWSMSNQAKDIVNEKGQSVLHAGVLTGRNRMVKAILKSGIEINLLDNNQKTPLDYAVESGNKSIMLRLIQHGARVTQADNALYLQKMLQRDGSILLGCGIAHIVLGILTFPLEIGLGCANLIIGATDISSSFVWKQEAARNWMLPA